MKKGKLIGVIVITAGLLTGCIDNMPDMTEEQSALIAEYAADIMLKYSSNYNYRIADEEDLIEEEVTQEVITEEVEETEEATQEPVSEENSHENEETEETKAESETNSSIQSAKEVDYAEIFAVGDVKIRYDSMEICSEYPVGEKGSGFSVNAGSGNSLIVLHMTIENTSNADITCDLFEKDFDISISVNKGNYKKVSSTLLVNDFTTYIEEIPAGETKDVVIVAEVQEITEEKITSCILRISSAETSITTEMN